MPRPFIPWIGNKEKLIPYINEVFPHNVSEYVEPFGGSGAYILSMPTSSKRLDVYNDFNSDLVNLFRCAKEKSNDLLRELGFLPFQSREEFKLYKDFVARKESYFKNIDEEIALLYDRICFTEEQCNELLPLFERRKTLFDVQCAADYFKRAWGSYNGTTTSFGIKPLEMPLDRLEDAVERLGHIVLEHKDAIDLIRERDSPTTVFYCDPPYFEAEKLYQVGFPKRKHVHLWKTLYHAEGYVIVSYNSCPYIRNLYKDFYILEFTRHNSMAKKAGAKYYELLITNYDPRLIMSPPNLFGAYTSNMRLIHTPRKPLKRIA
ncbi:MAG: DNA adenine methylase [Oscillospiraceae bacterium]|nr:DNA adenine methylase [Oscillospiraceae bacterium]